MFRGYGFSGLAACKDNSCPRHQGADYRLRVGRPRNPCSLPGRHKQSFFLSERLGCFWGTHPALSPGLKRPGREVDRHQMLRLMTGSITPFRAVRKVKFDFTSYWLFLRSYFRLVVCLQTSAYALFFRRRMTKTFKQTGLSLCRRKYVRHTNSFLLS